MTMLTTFILVGMVDSFDPYFATVELNTTPASNGGPSIAVMPVIGYFPVRFTKVKFSMLLNFMRIKRQLSFVRRK